MNKFEYKVITISAGDLKHRSVMEEIDHRFNEWGSQGWELIKLEPIIKGSALTMGSKTNSFLVVFSREKV